MQQLFMEYWEWVIAHLHIIWLIVYAVAIGLGCGGWGSAKRNNKED